MHQQGYSVAAILLLTTVLAVCVAGVSTVWLSPPHVDEDLLDSCMLGGLVVGAIVGLLVGLTRPQPLLAVLVGLPTGMFAGAASGALLAVRDSLPAMLVGSLLIVLFAVIVRLNSHA
jgi:hypothetical protein